MWRGTVHRQPGLRRLHRGSQQPIEHLGFGVDRHLHPRLTTVTRPHRAGCLLRRSTAGPGVRVQGICIKLRAVGVPPAEPAPCLRLRARHHGSTCGELRPQDAMIGGVVPQVRVEVLWWVGVSQVGEQGPVEVEHPNHTGIGHGQMR